MSSAPVPLFRRSFELAAAPASARLYISALGVYHVEINGHDVAGDVLAPGWCDFEHEVSYQTYDVTDALAAGENVIGVLLGDGAYSGRTGVGEREHYGSKPRLIAQLHLQLASGAQMVIATDQSWQWRPSWILAADPIAGESTDWRQFDPLWSAPQPDWSGFPVESSQPSVQLQVSRQRSVTGLGSVTAELHSANPQRQVFKLPQICVGRARLTAVMPGGAVLKMRYGLSLDDTGELAQASGEDIHVAAGLETAERLVSRFAAHAFRYVEVSGDLRPGSDITLTVETSGQPVTRTAVFHSDDAGLNDLFNRLCGYLATSLQSVPFAGLSSDSRQGWLADNALRIKSWLMSHACEPELGVWLSSIVASQLEDGRFPAIVPAPSDADALLFGAYDSAATAQRHHPVFSDALVEGTWQQFRLLGDRSALEAAYPAICRYLQGLAQRHEDHICGEPPADFYATLAYYRSVRTAARMAGVLGRIADLEDFEYQAAAIAAAFRKRFVTPDGRLVATELAAYVGVLSQNLLDTSQRGAALAEMTRLSGSAAADQAPQDLVPELLKTLTLLGQIEAAHEKVLALAETPDAPDAELARRSQAGVLEWLLTSLAGMDQGRDLAESANAYRRMRIQPRPLLDGRREDGVLVSAGPPIRSVEAQLDTVNGRYQVSWRISEEAFELTVVVPCNCAADVIMPDDTVHQVVSGEHHFTMPFQNAGDGIPILREVSGG